MVKTFGENDVEKDQDMHDAIMLEIQSPMDALELSLLEKIISQENEPVMDWIAESFNRGEAEDAIHVRLLRIAKEVVQQTSSPITDDTANAVSAQLLAMMEVLFASFRTKRMAKVAAKKKRKTAIFLLCA